MLLKGVSYSSTHYCKLTTNRTSQVLECYKIIEICWFNHSTSRRSQCDKTENYWDNLKDVQSEVWDDLFFNLLMKWYSTLVAGRKLKDYPVWAIYNGMFGRIRNLLIPKLPSSHEYFTSNNYRTIIAFWGSYCSTMCKLFRYIKNLFVKLWFTVIDRSTILQE